MVSNEHAASTGSTGASNAGAPSRIDEPSRPVPSPDRRERKKLATRDALRHAAIELFVEQGYAKTTILDITERADVGSRTFYRHFDSKEEVALVDVADYLDAAYAVLVACPTDMNPTACYFRLIEELEATWTRSSDELSILYDMVEADNALNGRLFWLMMQHQERVEILFAHRLGLDPRDSRVYAAASVGTMVFTGSLILAVRGDRTRSSFSHAVDLLLHYAEGIDPKEAKRWRARRAAAATKQSRKKTGGPATKR